MNRSVILAVVVALVALGGAYYYWTMPATTGTNNTAFDADFGAFASDSAAVDAALNDSPVQQESL